MMSIKTGFAVNVNIKGVRCYRAPLINFSGYYPVSVSVDELLFQ